MVFFGGNWTNNQHYYNKNNHNNHNNTNHSRETKQQQTQTQSDEQCPLLRHNTDNDRSYREHKRLFPVYEKTNQHVTDNDDPPPPPSLNQQQHSYIQSVLFGGLWTRNSLNEQSEPEQGDQDQDDEEQDRPSLTSHFEADTDLAVLKLCAIYTILYVLMAIVAFSFVFERWSIIDSTYFAVATFTTVGYGDLQPTTVAGQLFTIAFSVYGVIILGIFIGIFGHAISMGQQKALQRLQKGRQRHLLKLMFQTEHKRDAAKIIRKKSFFRDHISLLQDVMDVVRIEFPEIVAVIVFAMILGFREGWSLTSTLYFAIMSASTVSPSKGASKIARVVMLSCSHNHHHRRLTNHDHAPRPVTATILPTRRSTNCTAFSFCHSPSQCLVKYWDALLVSIFRDEREKRKPNTCSVHSLTVIYETWMPMKMGWSVWTNGSRSCSSCCRK